MSVVTVAVRTVSRMRAISPKYWPRPSRTGVGVMSTWTSPAMMKNIASAGSPRRTTANWAGTTWRFRSRAISAIRAASRPANSGTFATVCQVTTKSRFRISLAKPVARMPAGTAKTAIPITITMPPKTLPTGVIGNMSP